MRWPLAGWRRPRSRRGWPDVLSDLATLKVFLRLAPSDTSQDALLGQLLVAADRACKLFVKRDLETQVYAGYRDGTGTPDLPLRQRPVFTVSLQGTLTAGSPVVTGLSSTSALLAGMPCVVGVSSAVQAAVPSGAVISSVGSGQVTLSANATTTGSFPLVFGLAVWMDSGGLAGDGVQAFLANTQLYLGKDYVLQRDQPDGSSKSGILKRLGGGLTGSTLDWFTELPRGTLSYRLSPVWPRGYGNVKVVFTAGLGFGAPAGGTLPPTTTIPFELTQAVNQVASWMRVVAPTGAPLDATSLERQGLAMLQGENPRAAGWQTTLGILRRYREQSF
jgi:hypothetical protein